MRIAICEDILSDLNYIISIVQTFKKQHTDFFKIEYIPFLNPLELIASIEQGSSYDLIFLSTHLRHLNGLAVAEEIRTLDQTVKLIFLAATAEYAAQSYCVNAFYYTLKPLSEAPLLLLLDRVLQECTDHSMKSILVQTNGQIYRFSFHNITYIEVLDHRIFYHLSNGNTYESTGTLGSIEKHITSSSFIRTHRSFIVNMDYIINISKNQVQMFDDRIIPISRSKITQVQTIYRQLYLEKQQLFF